MRIHLLLALAGFAISFAMPSFAQQKDTVDPRTMQQIRALTMKYEEAYNSHDPAAVAAPYTEDGALCDDSQRSKARSGGHRKTL
jgi:hypothetical protein